MQKSTPPKKIEKWNLTKIAKNYFSIFWGSLYPYFHSGYDNRGGEDGLQIEAKWWRGAMEAMTHGYVIYPRVNYPRLF